MSTAQLAQLHARIQQLEADNASLACAAEQAAALAEEYAADAARFRHSQNNTEQRLHDEISDASRRKDRRIHRLTDLLSEEKHRTQQLTHRLEQLQQLNQLSGQMEATLQASVTALHHQVHRLSQSPPPVREPSFVLAAIRAPHAMLPLRILTAYFPQSDALCVDFNAFKLFLLAHSIHTIATYALHHIPNQPPTSSPQQPFVQSALQLFAKLAQLMPQLLSWCFENAQHIPHRAEKLHHAVVTMEQRTANVFEQLFEMQQQHAARTCTPQYATMNTQLLQMAVDSVTDVLPPTAAPAPSHPSPPTHDLSSIVTPAAEERARTECERRLNASRNAQATDELQRKLSAARTKLRQRESELDDIKVRLSVYEDRMTKAREHEKLSETLKIQLSKLQQELASAKRPVTPADAVQNEPQASSIVTRDQQTEQSGSEASELQQATRASGTSVATPLAQLQQVQDVLHTRRQLLRTQLSDISSGSRERSEHRPDLKDMLHVRDTLSLALNDLRTAAANASVVSLHPDTLNVKRGGKSMSQKIMLQAMAACCSNDEKLKEWRIARERVCDSKVIKVKLGDESMASTLALMRRVVDL